MIAGVLISSENEECCDDNVMEEDEVVLFIKTHGCLWKTTLDRVQKIMNF